MTSRVCRNIESIKVQIWAECRPTHLFRVAAALPPCTICLLRANRIVLHNRWCSTTLLAY